ncbi:hypothetical protein ACPCUV_05515 [Streptomyces platensis]|uniref:hypothetical protein n=1 Tax=Streptomyces platensis TaxID=58346 RepID=UPI003C2F7BB7
MTARTGRTPADPQILESTAHLNKGGILHECAKLAEITRAHDRALPEGPTLGEFQAARNRPKVLSGSDDGTK